MTESPLPPPVPPPVVEAIRQQVPPVSPERAAYNVVTDTVAGVNVRLKDNLLQLICVVVAIVLGALIGSALAYFNPSWKLPWYGGAMLGGGGGMAAGIFLSGIFLMIYRAARHIGGKHD